MSIAQQASVAEVVKLGVPGRAAAAEEADAPRAADEANARPEHLVSLPPAPPARSAELQLELRRSRTAERIATVRDTFKLLEDLDLAGADARASIAPAIKELPVEPPAAQPSDGKDGASGPTKELDALEAQLGPLEDRLLSLDDTIEDAAFESRMRSMMTNKRAVARYGRLLASRRMPVGPRRNRFEWLALQLLTRINEQGQILVAPPERARTTLQHLIGELPRKVRPEEVHEATDYLFEAGQRLDALTSVDEILESGLYADVHAHKVSMREHLLSAELVYRIALFEAKLHNHLERFVAAQVRAAQGEPAVTPAALRAELRKRLLAERDDVDARLGAKPRARPVALVPPRPSVARVPAKAKRAANLRVAENRAQRKLRVMLDRGLLLAIAGAIVISAAVYVVRLQTGLSGAAVARKLTSQEMPALSPLIVAGELRTLGDDQSLHGWISGTRWKALDPAAKRVAADEMARAIAAAGIDSAELFDHAESVITIRDGVVLSAAGAAP